jgi:predicted nucleic acid-binding protein
MSRKDYRTRANRDVSNFHENPGAESSSMAVPAYAAAIHRCNRCLPGGLGSDHGLTPRSQRAGDVVLHPFIVGEIALGHLKERDETIALLSELPPLPVADHAQALESVHRHKLAASGIGWVDAHLLCAASTAGVPIWTQHRALRKQARRLDLLYS